jgi:hypothetical protein
VVSVGAEYLKGAAMLPQEEKIPALARDHETRPGGSIPVLWLYLPRG